MLKYTVKDTDTGGLNSIAQRYGFSNYQAAGVKNVPSGNFNLIRPGDVITFDNYDPSKITGIGTTSPVVSSKDNEQQFREDGSELDRLLASLKESNDTKEEETERDPAATGEKGKDGKVKTTGDPLLDKVNAWEAEQGKKAKQEAEAYKKEYQNLYKTSLAAIDASVGATIGNLNVTFGKRIQEQERLNNLNIARVKAYGLGGGGQYTPISFGDAITNRETEAADKVANLENQRNALIAQAEAARAEGKSKALAEKITGLRSVDNEIRTTLTNIAKEAEAQYKLLRDLRKEEEEKHAAAVTKMKERLTAVVPKYAEEYSAMTEEEQDKFLEKMATQTGLDYATVYGMMSSAITAYEDKETKRKKDELEIKKDEMGLKKTEAEIGSIGVLNEARRAAAAASRANAAESYNNIAVKNNEKKMNAEIPKTFKNEDEFKQKRRDFIAKYGVDGQKFWDSVFFFPVSGEGSFEYDTGEDEEDPLGLGI